MAILIPNQNIINSQTIPPTQGEQHLINFLMENLNDEYEIYYQPYLNGKNPDIIIMRKNGGILIIEVKDWNLSHYHIYKNEWRLTKNNSYIYSPFDQVQQYKDKLFNLNYKFIFETIKNRKVFSVIQTAVYFHNATDVQIIDFIKNYNYNKYTRIIGKNNLQKDFLDKLLKETYISGNGQLFNDQLYINTKRYLKPTFHQLEIGKELYYTPEQKKLMVSENAKRQKVKGSAGSGKTLVLAKRAVNAHIRTQSCVLILTYNITLTHYIHDEISRVRENFAWKNFYITNYHSFFREQANQYNLKFDKNSFNNVSFFDLKKNDIEKYDAIFIDEIQDYEQEWLNIIIKYFTHENTELVVFGDEKQNIYNRPLDEDKNIKITTISGRWNRSLNKSFRFNHDIGQLALNFSEDILKGKYNIDKFIIQQNFNFNQNIIIILIALVKLS